MAGGGRGREALPAFKPPAPPEDVLVLPGQAGWEPAGAGPCGCPAFCAALAGSTTEIISGISPFCH